LNVQKADAILSELWDKDVRAWQKGWVPVFQKFAHDLAVDAKLKTGQIVLDIGTGTGIAANCAVKYVRPGGIVLGIDRSSPILQLAQRESRIGNVCFVKMNSSRLIFPNGLFDAVISNCGISPTVFPETVSEAFRVLREGGSLTLSDWRLVDVPAHRIFSEILRQHRTNNPSRRLSEYRMALATTEHIGNRYSNPIAQTAELKRAGFRKAHSVERTYRIVLHGIRDYLVMRFDREALRQELKELSQHEKAALTRHLKSGLQQFMRKERFVFEWKVRFTRTTKP
jgi:ubiquinone/menaquinone biosynthesis C-methylase UbiE